MVAMRTIMTFLLSIISSIILGQSFSFPSINKTGKTINDFIPKNWFLKDSCAGDLNGDNITDIAFVVELKDTINEIRPDSSTNRASPRILLIAFKNNDSNLYGLVLQNNTLIIRSGESSMDPDTFGKLSIAKKILNIEFEFIRGYSFYKFRFENNDFYLIGAVSNGVSGGEFNGLEVNFSTQKAKITTGDVPGEHEKIKWTKILTNNLTKLKDFKMLFTIEVLPDVYL
jgi:hypothetical protein